MVSAKTHKRKTPDLGLLLLLLIFIAVLTVIVCMAVWKWVSYDKPKIETENPPEVVEVAIPDEEPEPEIVKVNKIDFQPLVDEWVASVGGKKSVLIYDLELNEIVGAYNTKEQYNTASLYKLFVVYEGYRRLQSGEWQPDAIAGSTGYTISKCLDLAIRESYSPCAEVLWGMIGHDNLDSIIVQDFGITDSDISSLVSNAEDIMKIMQVFYKHLEITDETLITQMKDSFLTQPSTEYNWRQGLPSGFSRANVYNKVGWNWNGRSWDIYHDAAILEFPEDNRHFIVVVMSSQLPYQRITELGSKIESKYYEAK